MNRFYKQQKYEEIRKRIVRNDEYQKCFDFDFGLSMSSYIEFNLAIADKSIFLQSCPNILKYDQFQRASDLIFIITDTFQ